MKKIFLSLIFMGLFIGSAYGQEAGELQMTISEAEPAGKISNPEFIIHFHNTGETDFILNLGMMLANGKNLYPTEIHLLLTEDNGALKELELKGVLVGGRVDDYIVPLKSGATYSLNVNLNDYWSPATKDFELNFSKGKYKISAKYEGKGAQSLNEDMGGVKLLNFWKGSVSSNEINFEITKAETVLNESNWSEASHGLSAKLVLSLEDSSSYGKVIHPKVLLRNDSNAPIKFFKCVYYAGKFLIKDSTGQIVEKSETSRSGPQGASVVEIKPNEVVEFDAYDYGWGLSTDQRGYVFNTSLTQAVLKPGEYLIAYTLVFTKELVEKVLSQMNWIKEDPNAIWTGEISINGLKVKLK